MLKDDKLFCAHLSAPKKTLDFGMGTGIWAIDVAGAFTTANVVSMDISPIQPNWVPPNWRFEIDVAQLQWTDAPESFELIHIRAFIR